jgi:hypothetical protein
MGRFVVTVALVTTSSIAGLVASGKASQQVHTAETKAVAFLSREVPRWRREHPCYSCHNNGDAARALITASRKGHDVREALADTLTWLRQPARWNDKMPQAGIDDKLLARIQFAAALSLAVDAGLAERTTLMEAARFLAADQRGDGSWQLDTSQSLGSPATYGTVLATSAAVRTLSRLSSGEFSTALTNGESWLARVKIDTVIDAAAVVLGLPHAQSAHARGQRTRALEIIDKGESPGGGWGPFVTSPPDVFDTALVMLALGELPSSDARPAALARGRSFLIAEQLDDGSWPETTRPANQESYAQRISTTGWALLALLETGN